MDVLGIDVGGSGIKGAIVDTQNGSLRSERIKLLTPSPATPEAVASGVAKLCRQFEWQGPLGCGFPAVVSNGVAKTAANIDQTWIGVNVEELFRQATGCPCRVVNDADAAGVAEMHYGAGVGREDSVLVLTLGTGIGSALFCGGQLFPNLELGAFPLKGGFAEHYAAAAVRKRDKLSWQAWAKRINLFFSAIERILSPDLIILGGGVSRKSDKFMPYLAAQAQLEPAVLQNQAGIVGAACLAGNLSDFCQI